MSDANFFPHFEHSQIPFEILFTPDFLQKGHSCFCLCFCSTLASLDLTDLPYLAPNLPAAFVFFDFDGIFFYFDLLTMKWGCRTRARTRCILFLCTHSCKLSGFEGSNPLLTMKWGCPDLNRGREVPNL